MERQFINGDSPHAASFDTYVILCVCSMYAVLYVLFGVYPKNVD